MSGPKVRLRLLSTDRTRPQRRTVDNDIWDGACRAGACRAGAWQQEGQGLEAQHIACAANGTVPYVGRGIKDGPLGEESHPRAEVSVGSDMENDNYK